MEEKWSDPFISKKAPPKNKWRCDLLGDGFILLNTPRNVPWYRRFITSVLLGSKWTNITINTKHN